MDFNQHRTISRLLVFMRNVRIERVMMKQTKTDTTDKLLFLLEAQLFHGCTKKEALMLWNDGIDTLHDRVETLTTTERGL